MMDRGLDHLVYATPDLEASVEALAERFGTEPVPGGAHPGWGTRNALIGLGAGVYLEIIGPDPGQPDPEGSRPFLIDFLSDARLVTWAYRHPDPESMRDTLEVAFPDTIGEQRVQLGPVRAMSRAQPDGDTLHWRLSDPWLFRWAEPFRSSSTGARRHIHRPRSPTNANCSSWSSATPIRSRYVPSWMRSAPSTRSRRRQLDRTRGFDGT